MRKKNLKQKLCLCIYINKDKGEIRIMTKPKKRKKGRRKKVDTIISGSARQHNLEHRNKETEACMYLFVFS